MRGSRRPAGPLASAWFNQGEKILVNGDEIGGPVRWRMHISQIEFRFSDGTEYRGRIIQSVPYDDRLDG
jgi:hypothetical protein